MRFEEIYIDGFGRFHNYQITNLNSGLTIFAGPNEAGKSTLLAFIQRILFGFPDRRNALNLYPPLEGGNHGGRLTVLNNGKRYIIERYTKSELKVFLPDGTTGGTVELSDILGGVGKDVFQNIYAFGLAELQDFATLNSDAIKKRIYSAGAGLGKVSIAEIQKNLETEIGDLFREKGRKPEINLLFKEIKDVDLRLNEIEEKVANFDRLHRELSGINNSIADAEKDRLETRGKLNHTISLIKAFDDWCKIGECEKRMREIPEIENFPENGIEILDKNREKISELEENIAEKRLSKDKISVQKAAVRIDEKLLDSKEKIQRLQKGQDKYLSAAKDLHELEDTLKREKDAFYKEIHNMGPDWDEEKISRFDVSISTRESIRRRYSSIEGLREKIDDAEKDVERKKQDIEGLSGELEKIDRRLKTETLQEIDGEKLQKQEEALRIFRAKYPLLREKESENHNLEEREKLLRIFKKQHIEKSQQFLLLTVYAFVFTGIASLILFILRNNRVIGTGIFALVVVSGIIYILLSKKRSHTELSEEVSEVNNLSNRKEEIKLEIQKIKDEILSTLKICGFETIPEPDVVENMDSEIRKASINLLKLSELKKQREKLEQNIKKLSEEMNAVKVEVEVLRNQKDKMQKEWENILTGMGLSPSLTMDGVNDMFAVVKTCIDKKGHIEEIESRIKEMQKFIDGYRTEISEVSERCGRHKDGIDVIFELEEMSKDLALNEEDYERLKRLDLTEKELGMEIKDLEKRIEAYRIKISELLSQGHAKLEDEFREKAKNQQEINKLKEEILNSQQNIKRIIGDVKLYTRFTQELKDVSSEDLKETELQLQDKLKKIEERLSEFREKKGAVSKEIEQIERDTEGSYLRMKRDVLLERLKRKAEEWTVLVLASAIIGKAIEKYERERQPDVIKEAQFFFSKMTLNRYPRIFAPFGEAKIYVEDAGRSRKEIQDLSRGTAEQLYLSLRFGFIREFNKRAEPLPIIFDDILVNFDPERFRAACECIGELTKTNQAFYFTCHPESTALLQSVIPGSKVVNINI